jgi:hypothetical protein
VRRKEEERKNERKEIGKKGKRKEREKERKEKGKKGKWKEGKRKARMERSRKEKRTHDVPGPIPRLAAIALVPCAHCNALRVQH